MNSSSIFSYIRKLAAVAILLAAVSAYASIVMVMYKGADPLDIIVQLASVVIILFLIIIYLISKRIRQNKIDMEEIEKSQTEFVSIASHQLRTPATAVKWYTELLLDSKNLYSESRDQYAQSIYEANERMIKLVNSLLNVSRVELGKLAIKPKETDIEVLCKKIAEDFRPQAVEKEIAISFQEKEKLPIALVDPELLRIVVQNLISNALKYTNRKGKVTVSFSVLDSKTICIAVSDTGIGIPKEEMSKIFSKMYRAKNALNLSSDGNGLGLYLTHSVLQAIGGEIRFESTENVGTTFYAIIPIRNSVKKEGNLLS